MTSKLDGLTLKFFYQILDLEKQTLKIRNWIRGLYNLTLNTHKNYFERVIKKNA